MSVFSLFKVKIRNENFGLETIRNFELHIKIKSPFVSKNKFNLALPSLISAAAQQRSFRVYHQIQIWREKSPELWSWKKSMACFNPKQP